MGIKPDDILNNTIANLLSNLLYPLVLGLLWLIVVPVRKVLAFARSGLSSLGNSNTVNRREAQITRFRDFSHAEELEAQSKAIRYSIYGLIILGYTAMITVPLIIVFFGRFGHAIVLDMLQNLKPDLKPPLRGFPVWVARIWGSLIGTGVSGCVLFLLQAAEEAQSLSPTYRKKMIDRWDPRVKKIRGKA